jgi:glycosyltransferase involved in cell wall biosynthesis
MVEHLAARGDEVELITAFPHYPEWRFTAGAPAWRERNVEQGVTTTRVRHVLPHRGSSLSRVLSEVSFGLRALFSRWGSPDVVVLVSPALFASAVVLPRLLLQRLPFVVWVQDLYGLGVQETGGAGRLGVLVGRLEGLVLRSADAVVAISEQMAGAVQRLGVAAEDLTVVRNWTHIEAGTRLSRAAVRARFGWRKDETVVLHTGNMGAKQDLRNVVEAAREADRLEAPVRFVLMGDGVERPAVEAAAAGVARVQLLPSQPSEEYQSILQAADVLLVNEHPGVREMALPSKLTSYFASGRPVLAASNEDGATAAELRRAAAGVLVAPGRPEELLQAVRALAADKGLGRSLAAAGDRYRRAVLSLEGAGRSFGGVLDGLHQQYGTVDDLLRTMTRTDTVPVLMDHR